MLRRIICGAGAAVIAAAPLMANAGACFTESEWRAAHVRILQTELQVAALECANVRGASYNDQYTTFIQRFQDRLKANANLLKAHFQRLYGAGSGHELDIFVTKVANDASSRSMSDMKFCANSATAFQSALAIDKPQFEQAALDHVTDHSEVGDECPAPTKATQVAAKTTPAAAKPAVPKKATAVVVPASASAADTKSVAAAPAADAKTVAAAPAAAPAEPAKKDAAPGGAG